MQPEGIRQIFRPITEALVPSSPPCRNPRRRAGERSLRNNQRPGRLRPDPGRMGGPRSPGELGGQLALEPGRGGAGEEIPKAHPTSQKCAEALKNPSKSKYHNAPLTKSLHRRGEIPEEEAIEEVYTTTVGRSGRKSRTEDKKQQKNRETQTKISTYGARQNNTRIPKRNP